MQLSALFFIELNKIIDLSTFDCQDTDLNDYLRNDVLNYRKELISKTYLFTDGNEIIALFSVFNDNLVDKGEEKGFNKAIWNRLHRRADILNSKRIKQYPSVKIGRLGVNFKYQSNGMGSQILDFIKGWIVQYSKTACRFFISRCI